MRTVRFASVLTILLALLFLSVQPVAAQRGGPGGGMHGGTGPYHVQFMKQMIPHHQSAVVMARLCVERAAHDELIPFCQQIITTQSAEIVQMQTWLKSWYGINQPVNVDRMGQRMINRLQPLSGEAFDQAFLQAMIHHHQMAVMMGNRCVSSAEHAELRDFCANIVTVQSQEINQMQNWLCEWYTQCGGGMMGGGKGGCH